MTLTASGSGDWFSVSNLLSSFSPAVNESSKLLTSNVGFRSRVRYPTPRVPVGIMNLTCSCREISSKPVWCWCRLQIIAADPDVMLTGMYHKSADSCTFSLPSSIVAATSRSRALSIASVAVDVWSNSSGYLWLVSFMYAEKFVLPFPELPIVAVECLWLQSVLV